MSKRKSGFQQKVNSNVTVGYARVSTQKQVDTNDSLQAQEDSIRTFCDKNGYELAEIFMDKGISGSEEIINRDGINNLLDYCREKKNRVAYVTIDKIDRFSRDLSNQLFVEKELMVMGIDVLYVSQESLNGSDPIMRCMRQMMGAFAQLERDMIKRRLYEAQKRKAQGGDFASGRLPFGYKYGDNKKSVTVDHDKASVVRDIFFLRASGMSFRGIAATLNSTKHRLDNMSAYYDMECPKTWNNRTIVDMLNNKMYIGYIQFSGEEIKGNHDSIVDMELWNRVQEMNAELSKSKSA
jgi:DNA invertase Pin-like site-specific DNA recombinase